MSDLCLSRDELRDLTGTPIRARQLQFLLRNGIRHYIDLNGRPVVMRSTVTGTPQADAGAAPAWKSNKVA
ncbi:hypothetical protein ARC20_03420 [Stenotrophomonas panacihumi]|uniref:DUF4224 domain-containing protein n=1 Tax=Stenotrophomonas panacihumi TaxID=676599 RepID=A0A0R0B012_9GAMM|nr:DUF4224 domain-containing protein [Stenotrophomonas panacihumi]KRG47390.1 hypothetical protein ARC20_03420 [Stenotrophomonas panacihumi]PTN55868.1 DUF4224 domain-containing protein [Stenotrophomonas panacihumi]